MVEKKVEKIKNSIIKMIIVDLDNEDLQNYYEVDMEPDLLIPNYQLVKHLL
jgi:hypothetical protein